MVSLNGGIGGERLRRALSPMPVIKPTCIRDLKLRVNLADVVSRVVTLRKAGGARLKGLCPFHNEKTPSFHVDTDKGFYKCFGCGKAGDLITFVRETEQLGFSEAVEALGKRFGIVIEYEEGSGGPSPAERSLRQELFDLHDQAADHFHQAFKASDSAGNYFRRYWSEQRRFGLELADEFKIGAADEHGSGLGALVLRKKFSEEAIRRCGLFFISENAVLTLGTLRPRFRGRLMIPIRDHQGRVVAFTARQTELTPADDPAREAKYVNSPETPIFTKGNLLFNLDRARTSVGDGKPFVLVEGQLDAMRCWSVGLKTAVAPQGTSITESQLVLLRRYQPRLDCLFDSDSAGQNATERLVSLAIKAEVDVRVLRSEGAGKTDPDVLFQDPATAQGVYDQLIKGSVSGMEFLCSRLLPDPVRASPAQRNEAIKRLQGLVNQTPSQVARTAYFQQAAKLLAVDMRALSGDTKVYDGVAPNIVLIQSNQPGSVQTFGSITPESDLLSLILHFESLGKPLSHALPHEWVDVAHPAGLLLNRFLGEFEHDSWPGRDHLDPLLETPEERALVATLLFETPSVEDPVKVAQEGLRQLRARSLEPRLRQIELALANARADSDADPISLLKQRSEIQRQLRQPLLLATSV